MLWSSKSRFSNSCATPDTPFEIMSDGQCLVLTPVRESKDEKKFQKALEGVHARFGRAMKRLAE